MRYTTEDLYDPNPYLGFLEFFRRRESKEPESSVKSGKYDLRVWTLRGTDNDVWPPGYKDPRVTVRVWVPKWSVIGSPRRNTVGVGTPFKDGLWGPTHIWETLGPSPTVWRYRERKTRTRLNRGTSTVIPNSEHGKSRYRPRHEPGRTLYRSLRHLRTWHYEPRFWFPPRPVIRVHPTGPGQGTLVRRKDPGTRKLPSPSELLETL